MQSTITPILTRRKNFLPGLIKRHSFTFKTQQPSQGYRPATKRSKATGAEFYKSIGWRLVQAN